MTHPNIVLNWPAILSAVVAAFVLGGIWYGPLFGKMWAGLMGFKMDQKPEPKVLRKAMIIQFVGTFLAAYVLAHSGAVWRGSVWGVGSDGPDAMYGFFAGFFTWLGFYVPLQLNKVAWEMKPWKLFFINSGHDFVSLQIMAQILAHWR